jgi:hypothetical protein
VGKVGERGMGIQSEGERVDVGDIERRYIVGGRRRGVERECVRE